MQYRAFAISLRYTAQLPYKSWFLHAILAQEFYLRLMLFIDCHNLYLLLTHKVIYKIYIYKKHFLHSKEAIWKFISELNLVYFVLIFDLSKTFFGEIILRSRLFVIVKF